MATNFKRAGHRPSMDEVLLRIAEVESMLWGGDNPNILEVDYRVVSDEPVSKPRLLPEPRR